MTSRTVSATRSVAKPKRAILLVLAVAVAMLALPSIASAASLTWNGTTSTDYTDATNWTPNAVPSSSDDLSIGAATNQPTCGAAETCLASTIDITASGVLTVAATTGGLHFGTLTVASASNLVLTNGTIGPTSSGGTATLTAGGFSAIVNHNVNYGFNPTDHLVLGNRVEVDQIGNATMQGTLNIGAQTYDLIGPGSGSGVTLGITGSTTPTITIGNSGLLDNEGTGANVIDTVDPQVNMTGTTATIADHSTASPEQFVLANSAATNPGRNNYQGTIDETGSSSFAAIVLGNNSGSGNDWGAQLGGPLTINNNSHGRSHIDSQVVMFTSSLSGSPNFNLNATGNPGNTVTMNGDLTLDGSTGTGTFSGNATFASGSPGGDLLIHDGQFSGTPSAQTITIPSGTTAVVEKNDAAWNNQFTFNVDGVLLIDNQSITTSALPASAPTINIDSAAVMNHIHGASTVEPVVNSIGTATIEDSGNGLSLGNPNGVNTDTLSGTLLTQGQTCSTCGSNNSISLGFGGAGAIFRLTGPLTSDTFTDHAGGGGAIGTADSATDVQLNGQTLTIAGDGSGTYEFAHAAGTISGTGTINGPGVLQLAGGHLTPGSPMTFNVNVDQFTGGAAPTTVQGAGGHLVVNGFWFSADDIDYTGTAGTDVTINGVLDYFGGGGDSVDVPLIVNGSLNKDGSGSWTIDSTNGGNLATRCPGPVHCTTTIGSTGIVNADTGTLKIIDLTNVGGNAPNNTLTGGTYNILNGAVLQLPTASTNGVQHLDAPLTISGSGALQDTSGNPGLGSLTSVDLGATLHFLSGHSDTTALTTIDGTVILDGNSGISNAHGPLSGTTVTSSGLLEGDLGTFNGNLSNNGTVHPGSPGSPGTLTVNGRYSQGAGGALNVNINGTSSGQYGLLAVNGNVADLGGTLNVIPSASYQSAAATGDDIAFGLDAAGFTHTFGTVNVNPVLNSGRTVTIDYSEPGEIEVVVSAATTPLPTNTVKPVISGTAQQGQTLSTTNGTWTGSPTFTYQWADCNASGTGCTNISGAIASIYTLTANDVGHTVVVTVTGTNGGGSTPAASLPTATVTAAPVSKPVNTSAPAISGTAKQGQTLSTTNGTWTGSPTFTYQWFDCNTSGSGCATIAGATASSYKLAATDVGHTVAVVVTGTNIAGSTGAAGNPTGVITAIVPPVVKQHVSGVGLASKSFKASGGTSLNVKLAVAGKVKVVITQIISGRKVNGVCKASAKKGSKCTIKKQVRTVTFNGKKGSNKLSFKLKGLKKGSYSAKLTATNSAGKTSNSVTFKFSLK